MASELFSGDAWFCFLLEWPGTRSYLHKDLMCDWILCLRGAYRQVLEPCLAPPLPAITEDLHRTVTCGVADGGPELYCTF